jgi:hypothetical protein
MTTDNPTIHLAKGAGHNCADGEGCLFEWFNYLTNGASIDTRPAGVSPVLHRFGIALNDALPDNKRQELARYLPNGTSPLAGTENDGKDETRGWLAADWLIRTYLPEWLDLAGLTSHAVAVRGLPPVTDQTAAQDALPVIDAARSAARSAAGAARSAAGNAAGAARSAAWDARSAAWDAENAAGNAAGNAAWAARSAAASAAAAWAAGAAGAALVIDRFQNSAITLYDILITGEWPAS